MSYIGYIGLVHLSISVMMFIEIKKLSWHWSRHGLSELIVGFIYLYIEFAI